VVKISFKGNAPDRPLRSGASGLAAIYSGKCDACKFLRQLEIRSEHIITAALLAVLGRADCLTGKGS